LVQTSVTTSSDDWVPLIPYAERPVTESGTWRVPWLPISNNGFAANCSARPGCASIHLELRNNRAGMPLRCVRGWQGARRRKRRGTHRRSTRFVGRTRRTSWQHRAATFPIESVSHRDSEPRWRPGPRPAVGSGQRPHAVRPGSRVFRSPQPLPIQPRRPETSAGWLRGDLLRLMTTPHGTCAGPADELAPPRYRG
jgi:hypothetical protein